MLGRHAARARLWFFACVLASITGTALCLAGSATYTYDALGRLTVTTYANGAVVTYTLDPAGNRKNVSTTGVADTTPPTVPGVPTFSSITATTANATWTAAADNVGVTGYALYRGSDAGFVPSSDTLIQPNVAGRSGSRVRVKRDRRLMTGSERHPPEHVPGPDVGGAPTRA